MFHDVKTKCCQSLTYRQNLLKRQVFKILNRPPGKTMHCLEMNQSDPSASWERVTCSAKVFIFRIDISHVGLNTPCPRKTISK